MAWSQLLLLAGTVGDVYSVFPAIDIFSHGGQDLSPR